MISGFLNIVKPTGASSSLVVTKVKAKLGIKKVGHLGTLDPAASGVLPIAVGRATKFFDYFLTKDKVYRAVVLFGKQTDTLDSFGVITKRDETKVTEQAIQNVLPEFVGQITQVPPKYSALKVGGKKAYELARANIDFDIKPRKIDVFSIKLIKNCGKNRFLFEVHCSAGTYIRTLFSDIAAKLATVATTEAIIRTRSGCFDIRDAILPDELSSEQQILRIEDVFHDFKFIEVSEAQFKKLIVGQKLKLAEIEGVGSAGGEFFLTYSGELIGFYRPENGEAKQLIYLYDKN